MTVAPNCCLNNGELEIFTMGNLGTVETILNLHRVYKGTQDKHPKCDYFQASRVEVRSQKEVWVSPDGEVAGQLNAIVEIVPNALKMVMGPNPPVK